MKDEVRRIIQSLLILATEACIVAIAAGAGLRTNGAVVTSLTEGSPCATAGIEPGDVIVQINDRPILDSNELSRLLSRVQSGSVVVIYLERGERTLEVHVAPRAAKPRFGLSYEDGAFVLAFEEMRIQIAEHRRLPRTIACLANLPSSASRDPSSQEFTRAMESAAREIGFETVSGAKLAHSLADEELDAAMQSGRLKPLAASLGIEGILECKMRDGDPMSCTLTLKDLSGEEVLRAWTSMPEGDREAVAFVLVAALGKALDEARSVRDAGGSPAESSASGVPSAGEAPRAVGDASDGGMSGEAPQVSATTGRNAATSSSDADATPSTTYRVESDERLPGVKRSVDVILDHKVSIEELRAIAVEIKEADTHEYARTFILYYLPGMQVGAGAWASSHFDPELEVKILGPSMDKEEGARRSGESVGKETLGCWVDNSIGGGVWKLYRERARLVMNLIFSKDFHVAFRLSDPISTAGGSEYHVAPGEDNPDGLWFVVTGGRLQVWDNMGLVSTLPSCR
ncbi:MAG: PDZ domain-containing protein [Candidatus Eisenbacteria bacterium]